MRNIAGKRLVFSDSETPDRHNGSPENHATTKTVPGFFRKKFHTYFNTLLKSLTSGIEAI